MTYQAWTLDKRPIYSRLPGSNGAYSENIVVDWITSPWDDFLISTKGTLDNLPVQINPSICEPRWLDFLSLMYGWVDLWDTNWNDSIKRILLNNSYQGVNIWGNKGSLKVLEFILNTFQINHIIQLGESFLVDFSRVGDSIGSVSWEFDIILPGRYYNTDVPKLTEWIKDHFTPCWCKSSVIFDDTKFKDILVLIFEDGSYFSIGTDTALRI